MLFKRVHVHSSLLCHWSFFYLSKFYLDGKTPLLKQCISFLNCRLFGILMGLCLKVRKKYLSAKGVRSPKSLGTAAIMHCPTNIVQIPLILFSVSVLMGINN